MFRFENLEIWQRSINYCNAIYDVVRSFPLDELYGLTSQLKRAVVSVSANIAEGSGSDTKGDFKRFLNYAVRSNVEVVAELYIAKQRKFISDEQFDALYREGELLIKKIKAFKNSF